MGKNLKENVQFVISHIEGCSGNFLGRLAVNYQNFDDDIFRVDTDLDDQILAIDGRCNWRSEIDTKFTKHLVVVTHNFDLKVIHNDFPNARHIAIYPYTHVGNVLYNICYKKLTVKLSNAVDNHYIHLQEWHNKIIHWLPTYKCFNFWNLRDIKKIQNMLKQPVTLIQQKFFSTYWKNQTPLELDFPASPMTIDALLDLWCIRHVFNDWLVALVIYVYEYTNNLSETDRLWSIDDADKFISWQDVINIGFKYKLQGKTIC